MRTLKYVTALLFCALLAQSSAQSSWAPFKHETANIRVRGDVVDSYGSIIGKQIFHPTFKPDITPLRFAQVPGMFQPLLIGRCPSGTTIIFLLSGTTWAVDICYNSLNNIISAIAGGGGGAAGNSGIQSASGGGGGGFSSATNIILSGTVGYAIGAAGAAGATSAASGTSGGNTYFCNSTSNCASIAGSAVRVGANGGGGGTVATPGAGG